MALKMRYDRQWKPFARVSEEYIALTDGFTVVSLYRQTKQTGYAQPTGRPAPVRLTIADP